MGSRLASLVLRVTPGSLVCLASKGIGDQQGSPGLQDHQEFQAVVVAACLDLQDSQVREVKREKTALQASLCQGPQDDLVRLVCKVLQGSLDLKASHLSEHPAPPVNPEYRA